MTRTPRRARGLVDATTGEVLAVTQQGLSWVRAEGATTDVTPDFVWECVAAGGGAVAVAGPDALEWHGPDSARVRSVPAEPAYRLAVDGPVVAAVSQDGRLTVWRSPDADPRAVSLDIEPDGVALDPSHALVGVWGWDATGHAVMTVLRVGDSLSVVEPSEPWPAPDTALALGLTGGVMAVGGTDAVTLVSAEGARLGRAELPGLERLTGRAATLGWIRSAGADDIVVGVGRLAPGAGSVVVVAEAPMPGTDPFPEFTPVPDGDLVLVSGVGPHELCVQRLTEAGWSGPERVSLPTRA